jgi:hypothetical protein
MNIIVKKFFFYSGFILPLITTVLDYFLYYMINNNLALSKFYLINLSFIYFIIFNYILLYFTVLIRFKWIKDLVEELC